MALQFYGRVGLAWACGGSDCSIVLSLGELDPLPHLWLPTPFRIYGCLVDPIIGTS